MMELEVWEDVFVRFIGEWTNEEKPRFIIRFYYTDWFSWSDSKRQGQPTATHIETQYKLRFHAVLDWKPKEGSRAALWVLDRHFEGKWERW